VTPTLSTLASGTLSDYRLVCKPNWRGERMAPATLQDLVDIEAIKALEAL
jgi:hypothetical protein